MDVSHLRQRILRALEAGQNEVTAKRSPDATARRAAIDAANVAYERFLDRVAVPLLKQAQDILKAEGQVFTVYAPADGAKLVADGHPATFLEFALDSSGDVPQVLGRISRARGRRVNVEERALADKPIQDLSDDDVAAFLVTEIPKLVQRS